MFIRHLEIVFFEMIAKDFCPCFYWVIYLSFLILSCSLNNLYMVHLSYMHMVNIFSLFFGLPLRFMVFFDELVFKVSLLLDGHLLNSTSQWGHPVSLDSL